jgi:putative ABC transport system permease protein
LTRLAVNEAARTVVINEALASIYFRNEDPIGKHLTFRSPPTVDGSFEVAGVVENVRNQGIQQVPAPHVYLSGATTGPFNPLILVRTSMDPTQVLSAVRGEIAIVDRRVALRQPGNLREVLAKSVYSQPRFSLIVLGIFAVTGTLLVAVGVFSVMAYTVSRQTKEIAVRMALGAGRWQVLGVVLRLGAQLVVAGAAAGLLASFATSRLIANQLWNTSPHDPMILAAATVAIAVVALAACYIPARRAMTVDPMAALRCD